MCRTNKGENSVLVSRAMGSERHRNKPHDFCFSYYISRNTSRFRLPQFPNFRVVEGHSYKYFCVISRLTRVLTGIKFNSLIVQESWSFSQANVNFFFLILVDIWRFADWIHREVLGRSFGWRIHNSCGLPSAGLTAEDRSQCFHQKL